MGGSYTATIQQDGRWWIGWIQEIPGVNAQEETREELIVSLGEALKDMLELNRAAALSEIEGNYEEIEISA